MTTDNNNEFEKQLQKWETWGKQYFSLSQMTLKRMEGIEKKYQPPKALVERVTGWTLPSWARPPTIRAVEATRAGELKADTQDIWATYEKEAFFYRLYGETPLAILGGQVTDADEVLSKLSPPPGLSSAELEQAREAISEMLTTVSGVRPEAEAPVEDLVTAEGLELPELEIPTEVSRIPLGIHKITTEEIVRQLKAPEIPDPVMTNAEWTQLMMDEGYSAADLETVQFIEDEAQRVVDNWTDLATGNAALRDEIAEMPEYKLTDLLLEAVKSPGLTLLEIAGTYFEHVSMPLAGFFWKEYIPDIEAEYQRLKQTESTWEALGHAWHEWDGTNWFLKYVLMEGLVDPLSYVGFGIATRITRPIPMVGKFVGAAERGALQVMEIPFDLIKALARRAPKTIAQRGLLAQAQAGQYVEAHITKYWGRPLYAITMPEFNEAAEVAIKFAFNNPMSESKPALAGREFLKHSPIDEITTRNWAERLGSGLTPDQITKETVAAVDDIFEAAFWKSTRKGVTHKEAAGRLLGILDAQNITESTLKLAQQLIKGRADAIQTGARVFGKAKTGQQAQRALMSRNRSIYVAIEKSKAALVRREAGTVSAFLQDIGTVTQRVWGDQIDRMIVRPFAEAYLTFGMYGPMNVLEDYIRSSLAGVFPRRMGNVEWAELTTGLLVDPQTRRAGWSETMGELYREGEEAAWNNWILQLGGLAKGWGELAYKTLVVKPGAIGMDLRRNMLGGKFLQVYRETGGEAVEKIVRAGPTSPTVSRWVSRKRVRQLESAVYRAKTTGNPDVIRGVKEQFTKDNILKSEIDNILKEHPNLPNPVRDITRTHYNDGRLFRTPQGIEDAMEESRALLMDDFLRSPERATEQFKQLADTLMEFEVRNPQDMAMAIQQLNVMSKIYGGTPRQISAQATIRSRGLPFIERRDRITKDLDQLVTFMDRAGADVDRVIERLRTVMGEAGVSSTYVTRAERLFDIMITKREASAQFRAQNVATRQHIFEAATAKDVRSSTFWDDFYIRMDSEYHAFNVEMARLEGLQVQAAQGVDRAAGIKAITRPPIKVTGRSLAPQDVATLMGARGDDISRALMDVLTIQNDRDMFIEYIMGHVKSTDVGFTRESVGAVYDQISYSLHVNPEAMSWVTGKQMELDAVRRDLHALNNSKIFPAEEKAIIDSYIDETADAVDKLMYEAGVLKPEFQGIDDIRQGAYDEAAKWYYKEFTDYTNANAFDAMMKSIYPFWTYESQRWFWLPRSFMRHPGTFTAFERWQDNTDFGYVHIPGTSIDINPFRGTIYGTLSTRLTRRDFPEYYDALPIAGDFVEGMDFLSRWGFYPGAHIGIPLAIAGGLESQYGEVLPAIWKTPLNALIATFPENESVKWISETIFSDRFRDYMTIIETNKRGYDGTLIWSKMQENIELTQDEQSAWDDARQEAAFYGMGFEQFGLFRLRTDEQYKMYEESSKVIEEMTGYTLEQQDWLRRHGYRIWDLVGGLSPTNQAILQEMESYKWTGSVRPMLPGRQQEILTRLELDWDDVRRYTEEGRSVKLDLQQQFLSGALSPSDYIDRIQEIQGAQRTYIDRKMEENPIMTLEGRKDYYKEYGIAVPVMHPHRELLNLYFDVELKDKVDEETGQIVQDWDTFWAMREAIENAVPEEFKQEWDDYLSRNTTRIEQIRQEVNSRYFKFYNRVWEKVLSTYPEQEQRLIKEYLSLEQLRTGLDRQEEIKAMTSAKTGNLLVSSFRSDVSEARQALRYANPSLDAWLFYWGRTTSFQTEQAKQVYEEVARETGRVL